MLLSDDLVYISTILKNGNTILYPTDSIWGIGCDPFNQDAVNKVYQIKERDSNKPFVLLVPSIEELKKYIIDIHPRVESLLCFHNKPLTVIYKASPNLPSYLSSEQDTIAIRVIHEPVIQKLLNIFGKPLVSTSANKQGNPFPQTFEEISENIKDSVDYVFKYKREDLSKSDPSVMISFNYKGQLTFIRE